MSLSSHIVCFQCRGTNIPREAPVCPNCGVHFGSHRALARGATIKDLYDVDYVLGEGGFGITYRAIQRSLGRPVAIKEYFPAVAYRNANTGTLKTSVKQQDIKSFERGLQRFKREGRFLVKCVHPAIVRAIDLIEENDTAYLVMELIEGEPLSVLLESLAEQGGTMPVERVRGIGEELVDALGQIHAKGYHHLDIKPDNIMLKADDGRPVLIDFGAARQGENRTSTQAYSEAYAPLEVSFGGDVGPGSDIYELGVVLVEMLHGKRPPTARERRYDKDFKDWTLPEFPKPWGELLHDALKLDLDDRPDDIKAWWRLSQQPVPEPTGSPEPPPPDNPRPPKATTIKETSDARLKRQPSPPELGLDTDEPSTHHPPSTGFFGDNLKWLALVGAGAALTVGALVIDWGEVITDAGNSESDEPTVTSDTSIQEPEQEPEPEVKPRVIKIPSIFEGMVKVPAGQFLRGSTSHNDEKPPRLIHLDEFWIDKHEVTAAQYRDCVEAEGCTLPSRTGWKCDGELDTYATSERENHPINCVDWDQAMAFCKWKGRTLPTEAQWEKAARGGCEKHEGKCESNTPEYPWGSEDPTCERTNFSGCGGKTKAVGSHPYGASPYGAHDMTGNVWEWTQDRYSKDFYQSSSESNPVNTDSGHDRVRRGGCFFNFAGGVRAAYRIVNAPGHVNADLGFRCARSFH